MEGLLSPQKKNLEQRMVDGKGRAVFATQEIFKGEYVTEYVAHAIYPR